MDVAVAIVTGTVIAATPLLFAAMGELVVERSGVLNLGIEGMMLIGAVTAFSLSFAGYPAPVAAAAAVAAGAASSLLFGVLALTLLANQYAAGIALAILGGGLSGFLGRNFGAAPIEPVGPIQVPVLSEIPFIGPVLFGYDPMVYLALALVRRRVVGAVPHPGGAGHPDRRREPAGRARRRLPGDPDPLPPRSSSAAAWRASAGPISRSPTPRYGSRT